MADRVLTFCPTVHMCREVLHGVGVCGAHARVLAIEFSEQYGAHITYVSTVLALK
jgi:hypothetical protein